MIRTSIKENLAVNLTNGVHTIVSDVGANSGGDDSALNPHELLEASLGACTTITVMMYAKRKKLPILDVVTTVKVISESGEANEVLREIEFVGDLSLEDKNRLMEIANKCPMHKFLSKSSRIDSKMVQK